MEDVFAEMVFYVLGWIFMKLKYWNSKTIKYVLKKDFGDSYANVGRQFGFNLFAFIFGFLIFALLLIGIISLLEFDL